MRSDTKRAVASNSHHEGAGQADKVDPPSERSFGRTFAVVFALLAAWFLWRRGLAPLPLGLAAGAAGFWALAYLAPRVLRPLNVVWFRFGLLLHAVVSPLILGLLFFLVVTPTGVIMRMAGKDFLGLRRSGPTYWIRRDRAVDDAGSMINQF